MLYVMLKLQQVHSADVASNQQVRVVFHRELCFQIPKLTQAYQSRRDKDEG